MAKAEYRSSIRSKNMIKHAVAKLIQEKELSKITVTDVIQTADISRGTFYAHYTDIYAVLEQIENEELDNLLQYVKAMGFESFISDPELIISRLCKYVSNDIGYYRMLILSTPITSSFLNRLSDIFAEKAVDEVTALPGIHSRDEAYAFLCYMTNGAKAVIIQWLSGAIELGTNEVIAILTKIVKSTQSLFSEGTV